MLRPFSLILVCLILLCLPQAYADLPVRWQVWHDTSANLSLEHARQQPASVWRETRGDVTSFGFSQGTVWLRAILPATCDGKHWVELANPPLDVHRFWVVQRGAVVSALAAGTVEPHPAWQPPYHNQLFPVHCEMDQPAELWLATRGNPAMFFHPRVLSEAEFGLQAADERFWLGAYAGLFLALMLYSALVAYSTRSHSFAFYIIFLYGNGMMQLNMLGASYGLGLYHWPAWFEFSRTLNPTLTFFGFLIFTRQFLELHRFAPKVAAALKWAAMASFILPVLYFLYGNAATLRLATQLGTLVAFAGAFAGAYALRQGFRPARFFLLAQAFYLIGGTVFVLVSFNLIPVYWYTLYAFQIGAVLEAVFIALALSDKINLMQSERDEAQEAVLRTEKARVDSLRESERLLEGRVTERTQALQAAMEREVAHRETLEQANAALARLNHDKNAIMGVAAHDLKNPGSMIVGYVELLKSHLMDWPKEKQMEKLEHVRRLAQRILDIIGNLLDINTIESGQLKLSPEAVEVYAVCQNLLNEYADTARAKSIVLHLNGEAPLFAWVDKGALYQMLDNLLSNAIKYSHTATEVSLQIQSEQGQVRVVVKDQGQGIPEGDLPRLFAKFARLTPRPTAGETSTGLGLSIVQQMAHASGGEIRCQTEFGKGSEFTLVLPVAGLI